MSCRDTVACSMLAKLKLLSPKVIFVCGTTHVLSAADWRRRQPLTATRLMSSAKCAGARPDNDYDWCSGILLCTLLMIGQEASETGAANAWYGHVVYRWWWGMSWHSGLTVVFEGCCQKYHTTMSCRSLNGKKRKLQLVFGSFGCQWMNSWMQLSTSEISASAECSDVCR